MLHGRAGVAALAWVMPFHSSPLRLVLSCLLLAFLGLSRLVFAIGDGRPRLSSRRTAAQFPEGRGIVLPPLVLMVFSLWLGVATPGVLEQAWAAAVAQCLPVP